RDIAAEKGRQQRQATISDVTGAYGGVVQAKSAAAASAEALRFYAELQAQIERNVEHQTALAADLLDVKASRAKAVYDALVATDGVDSAKEKLNLLLGRDIETKFDVAPPPEAAAWDVDEAAARKLALERRSEVRQARMQAEEAGVGR